MNNRGGIWPGMVFVLIGLNMVVVAVTIVAASVDDSMAVEPDYYQQAVQWDEHVAQRERNRLLNWKLECTMTRVDSENAILTVRVRDGSGEHLEGATVRVVAFASVRAAQRQPLILKHVEYGTYQSLLAAHRDGLWVLDMTVAYGSSIYVDRVSTNLSGTEVSP